MKQLIISLILCLFTTVIFCQNFTVYTNSIEKHDITTGQIYGSEYTYATTIFTNTMITQIINNSTYIFTVVNVIHDTKNNQYIYTCYNQGSKKIEFFLRKQFIAIDIGEFNKIYVLYIYQKS